MGKLTALYLSKGYAAARFYLPEQDLKTGTLKLRVEEGKLSQLQLTERAKGTMSLKTAIIGAERQAAKFKRFRTGTGSN